MDPRQLAVEGWTLYVLACTRNLPATALPEERMATVLAGDRLPDWLEDGILRYLTDARAQAMAA